MRSHGRIGLIVAFLVLLSIVGAVPSFGDPDQLSASGGSRWGANYFPNVPLTTHEGRTVRFFDDLLQDKVVVINFIYTTCPDVCPLETARLTELQDILGERVGRDVFMYSITIDPEVDTPEVLKEYAERFHAGPGWLFLTGDKRDITLLRRKLGLYREEPVGGLKEHNLSLIIGNQGTGRWMKRSPYENPYYLANQVGSWLHNWKTPAPNQSSYANAPRLRTLSLGESLFRTRCMACHVVGGRENVPKSQSARLIGPDLFNVTERRERTWLARWLMEPDKMLAEKDPIAIELFAKHDKVSMPNLSLNAEDVEALLEFLEQESRRYEMTRPPVDAATASEAVEESPHGCCQKDKGPVLHANEEPAPTASVVDKPDSSPRREVARSATLFISGGLGCAFLLLAAIFRRRAAMFAQA